MRNDVIFVNLIVSKCNDVYWNNLRFIDMPRPKTKDELLSLSKQNFDKLNNLGDSFNLEEQEKDFVPGTMNRNIRDVIAHLHHWHLLMLNWYKVGMQGDKPIMPAEGYTWKTLPAFNKMVWEQYKDAKLGDIITAFNQSFLEVSKLIEQHTNDELFEKKRYKWTGTTSLGAYLVSSTSSHYDWANKLIKKGKK